MGVYASIISSVIGTAVNVASSSGGPNYPAQPKFYKLPVAAAKKHMEQYEKERMAASVDAWKGRFPLLYKGGQAEIEDIRAQQQGKLGKTVAGTLAESGLEAPTGAHFGSGKAGSPEALGLDIGLNPLALSQRSSQSVVRQLAMNPEWTNKITGGTLASMLASANANQNAFTGFLGAQRAAMYTTGQAQGAMNTATLLRGITGTAGNIASGFAYNNDPFNLSGYQAGSMYGGGSPDLNPAVTNPVSFNQPPATNFYSNASYAAPGQPGYQPAGGQNLWNNGQAIPSGWQGQPLVPPEYDYGNIALPGAF